MKSSLLLIFTSFLFITQGFSQGDYEHVFIKEKYSRITNMEVNQGKATAVGSWKDNELATVWQLDEMGDLLWKSSPIGGISQFKNILQMDNQELIVSGPAILYCDLIDSLAGFAVVRLDSLGNTIFNTQLRYEDHSLIMSTSKTPLLILNDSTLWMGAREKIFQLNLLTGDSLSSIDYSVDEFVAFVENDDEISALSQRKLMNLSETGEVQSELIFYEDLTELKVSGDTSIIAGTTQVFTVVNNVVDSLAFDQLQKIDGMTQDLDGNWLVWGTENDLDQITVFKFDNNLTFLANYSYNDTRKHFTNIRATNEGYFMSGFDDLEDVQEPLFLPYRGDFVSKKTDLLGEQFPKYHDIGIVDLILETAPTISGTDTLGQTIVYYIDNNVIEYSMTVENFGDTPIDVFGYASSSNGGVFCSLGRFVGTSEEPLMPGEQSVLTATLFIGPAYTTDEFNFCFFVHSPNEEFDQEFDNNQLCTSFVLTADKEVPLTKNNVQIFPNPAEATVYISTENAIIENWELTDLSGQKLAFQNNIQATQTEIYRNDLPAGVYFLKIATKDDFLVKRIVFK